MSFNTKNEAVEEGKRVRALMTTDGWKVEAWENCGWYVALVNKYMTLYIESYMNGNYYYVLMDDKFKHAGKTEWTETGRTNHRNPNKAVETVLRLAEKQTSRQVESIRRQRLSLGLPI